MRHTILAVGLTSVAAALAAGAFSQTPEAPVLRDQTPAPYHRVEGFAVSLPKGQAWGSVPGVGVSGGRIWAVQRCGANSCDGSTDDPVIQFDMAGKPLASFGAGMFIGPHGLSFDKAGHAWICDYQGKAGKGHQCFKFDRDGKVLMTLGIAGVSGAEPGQLSEPNEVAVAPNGDLFVAQGHGFRAGGAARIDKFTSSGKFIKTWGGFGDAPGQFKMPHAMRFDALGRLWVADRGNNRLQVFDQDGKALAEYRQFGRPVALDLEGDILAVADSESTPTVNPGYPRGRGITLLNWRTLTTVAFIPLEGDTTKSGTSGPEAVKMSGGAVYAGMITQKLFVKYVK